MDDKVLSIQEVAAILKVTTATLRNWEERGILKPQRTQGNHRRYSLAKIEEFKKSFGKKKVSVTQGETYLTIQDAAKKLKVTPATLRNWEARRKLVPERSDGNHRRYTKRQVELFKNESLVKRKPNLDSEEIKKPFSIDEALAVDSEVRQLIAAEAVSRAPQTRRHLMVVSSVVMLSSVLVILILVFASDRIFLAPSSKSLNNISSLVAEKGRSVLAAATGGSRYTLNVNVPANFLKDVEIKGLTSALGGVITQNADVNAGTGKLTASNVIYSLTAGTGIGITGGQNATITNTGVLSIGGQTGAVTLTAGSGISISGNTITNTSPGPGTTTDSFSNIVVGSDTITAGSSTDSLEFAAGSGVTLSADTANKIVTITATGGSGTGDVVGPGSATDNALVRFDSTTGKLIQNSLGILDDSGNLSGLVGLSASGTITFSGFTSNGGILYTNSSGVLAQVTAGTASQCLFGGTNPSFGSCAGSNYWQLNSGALSPFSSTADLLVGGTSTASAKFAFINALSGTPTASISANSGNIAAYLTGDGTLATTNRQTLTIGNSSTYNTTGNVVINPNGTGFVGISKSNPSYNLDVTGDIRATNSIRVYDPNIGLAMVLETASLKNTGFGSDMTLSTYNGSGIENTDQLILDSPSGNIGIRTNTPIAQLHVTRPLSAGANGRALAIFDQIENQDIFTASKSGVTEFVINSNGNIQFTGSTSFLTTLTSLASATRTITFPDATGTVCLQSSSACGFALGTNYWQLNSNALSPSNSTYDVLFGATSTTSAKFAFLNNAGGTPTASISANSGNNALYLTGNGTLATANRAALTIGNSSSFNTTGDVLIQSNGQGNVGIGTTTPTTLLTVRKDVVGALGPTLTIENGAGSINAESRIDMMTYDPGANSPNFRLGVLDDGNFGAIVNLQTKVTGANTNSLTSRLYIKADGSVGIGTTSPGALLEVGDGSGTTQRNIYINGGNSGAYNGFVIRTASSEKIYLGRDGTDSTDDFILRLNGTTNVMRVLTSGAVADTLDLNAGKVGIGTSTPLATLDIRSNTTNGGTIAIASASGSTSFAAFLVDNNGLGDLFTASKSGATKFTVLNNGNLSFFGTKSNAITLSSNATAARSIAFPDEAGTICLQSSTNCGFALGTNYWQLNSNALSPSNSTYDVLFGATSTASAKFAFLNNAGGTPTASISANSGNNATFLTGAGVLGTTNKQTLTIANSTTGNVNIDSKAIALNSSQDGTLGSFSSTTVLPVAKFAHTSVVANGYVYAIGGTNGTDESSVYYAKLNSNGTVGSWLVTTSLPQTTVFHSSIAANGYVYVIGGFVNSTSTSSSVYYAKVNSNGTLGSWTATTSLPNVTEDHSSVVANGYVYVIGGDDGAGSPTYYSSVYYAKLNSDGTVGSWASTTSLPQVTINAPAVTANGYMYVLGGDPNYNGGGAYTTVYYSKLNSSGTIGSWVGTTSLPQATALSTSVVANGYIYLIGGCSNSGCGSGGTTYANIYYAALNSTGSIGSWTAATSIPQLTDTHSSVVVNGYVYVIGGVDHYPAGAAYSTVYYASLARTSIAGNLDLLGLTAQSLTSSGSADFSQGSVGGSIYAGNIFSAGNLEISGNSQFWGNEAINGSLSISNSVNGPGLFVNSNSGGYASAVINSTGVGDIFTASSSGTTHFKIANNGDVTVVGSVTTCTIGNGSSTTSCSASDQRLKSNIATLQGMDGLAGIRALNPVSFNWNSWMQSANNASSDTQFGFIAQEVASVFPNLVSKDPNTGFYKLDYQGLFGPIVKAIQEQQIQIDNINPNSNNLNLSTITVGQADIDSLVGQSASFSGTLTAGTIHADNIDGLTALLGTSLESTAAAQFKFNTLNSGIASVSARVDNIEDLLRQVNFVSFATGSGQFASVENLMVSGSTTLAEASIVNNLTIGNNLTISGSSINTIGTDLEIQPLAQGNINFFGGKITFDTEGNIKVVGNAEFVNDVKVGGVLSAKTISIPKGTITDISLTESIASASAGISYITQGQLERKITSEYAKSDSVIIVTPESSTAGDPIYVKEKDNGSFVVGIDSVRLEDLKFNFLIVNQ